MRFPSRPVSGRGRGRGPERARGYWTGWRAELSEGATQLPPDLRLVIAMGGPRGTRARLVGAETSPLTPQSDSMTVHVPHFPATAPLPVGRGPAPGACSRCCLDDGCGTVS